MYGKKASKKTRRKMSIGQSKPHKNRKLNYEEVRLQTNCIGFDGIKCDAKPSATSFNHANIFKRFKKTGETAWRCGSCARKKVISESKK